MLSRSPIKTRIRAKKSYNKELEVKSISMTLDNWRKGKQKVNSLLVKYFNRTVRKVINWSKLIRVQVRILFRILVMKEYLPLVLLELWLIERISSKWLFQIILRFILLLKNNEIPEFRTQRKSTGSADRRGTFNQVLDEIEQK